MVPAKHDPRKSVAGRNGSRVEGSRAAAGHNCRIAAAILLRRRIPPKVLKQSTSGRERRGCANNRGCLRIKIIFEKGGVFFLAGFDRRNDEWLAEEAEVDRLIWLNDCRSRNGVDYNTNASAREKQMPCKRCKRLHW